jgi:hypothetical protein
VKYSICFQKNQHMNWSCKNHNQLSPSPTFASSLFSCFAKELPFLFFWFIFHCSSATLGTLSNLLPFWTHLPSSCRTKFNDYPSTFAHWARSLVNPPL